MVEHLPSMHEVGGLTCSTILKENGLVGHGRGNLRAVTSCMLYMHADNSPFPTEWLQPKGTVHKLQGRALHLIHAVSVAFSYPRGRSCGSPPKILYKAQMFPAPALFCELHPHVPKCCAMCYCPLSPRTLKLSLLLLSPQFS